MVAMVEYILHGAAVRCRIWPDIDPAMLIGDIGYITPAKKAPPFIKDALIFRNRRPPFSLRYSNRPGWEALAGIFTKPPGFTQ